MSPRKYPQDNSPAGVPGARPFTHLHVHSQYSLLDGACRIGDMVARAKELGQDALAITDHGCLFGVVDFYTKARGVGVKPIVGIEAYMTDDRRSRTTTGVKDGGHHLLLLAQNHQGYRNLLKLSSIAYREGFYYKPRIDKETLAQFSDGLVCTSACLGGEIPSALMSDNRKRAKQIAEMYLALFGPDRFFIEVQKHIREQDQVNPELITLADQLGVGVVATNDVHFLLRDDHAHHDALCCISTGKLLSDESRMKYPTQLYLKSADEMYSAWDHPRWAEACANTALIAAMCELELNFKQSHAPVVKIARVDSPGGVVASAAAAPKPSASAPDSSNPKSKISNPKSQDTGATRPGSLQAPALGSTAWFKSFCAQFQLQPFDAQEDADLTADHLKTQCDDALRQLAEAGAVWRYGVEGITPPIRARLDRELKILADKNISAYFLIVWDFVNEARRRGIPANARGSGVGTMVGYVLGLSNACPVQYGLLFERFTDPDRSEYPDIDIDMCQDGRQEIIDYVRQKYGHVAQIITFGTLKARAAIRDVGRVLNVPLSEVDKIAKLVPEALGTTLDKALDQEPDLRKMREDNPVTRKLLDTARRLEGLSRHAGVHAAGVIIATQPLDNIVPLYQPPGTDQTVTQWDGPTCEKVGLLKMDFLGLRTLSILEKAKALIHASLAPDLIARTVAPPQAPHGHAGTQDPLDLERLTYDDPRVLDLFTRGETAGVFQFESGGMRNMLLAMKPDRLEDLIAANALYRPGPMDLIPDYCDRKHGRKPVPQAHPIVRKFTSETYGIMVYQEQVMQIVHELGGIPLRAAYTLIKAISKKKQKDIDAVRPKFIEGAVSQGLDPRDADELFGLILKFAGYGFNKSHSTGYAIIAYQTAYLKTFFPVHYMAALLTYESVSTEKVVEYIDECKRVLRPALPGDDGQEKRGIDVRPPDINKSDPGFTVVFDEGEPHDSRHGHIRFGLSAVKGIGEKAVTQIIRIRNEGGPFRSLFDFCERVPHTVITKASVEAFIKCGAFDCVHGAGQRAAMVAAIEAAMGRGAQEAALRSSEDFLFGAVADSTPAGKDGTRDEPQLPGVKPWTTAEQLTHEKSVLGLYVSNHPLNEHRDTLTRFSNTPLVAIRRLRAELPVIVGGMLTRVKPTFVKNGRSAGQKMAMITIDDGTAAVEGVIFADAYAVSAPLVELDRVVFLKGKIDRRREEPNIIVDEVIPLEQAPSRLTQAVRITLDGNLRGPEHPYNGELTRLNELLRQAAMSNGNATAEVLLDVVEGGRVVHFRMNRRVAADADLPVRIATVLRAPVLDCCELLGPPKLAVQGVPADAGLVHSDAAPQPPRLVRAASDDDEFCASIDRY